MLQLRNLHLKRALIVVIILGSLSIWNIDLGLEIKKNHQNIIVSPPFKTLLSPTLEQASNYSVYDNTPPKGDDQQPLSFKKSSRDRFAPRKHAMNNAVSGLPIQSASTYSFKNTTATNPSSRDDLTHVSLSASMHMKDYCIKLTQGTATHRLLKWAAHYHPPKRKQKQYINSVWVSCDNFLHASDYIRKPLNSQDDGFPIAYSIVMYKDPEQVERLLHAIYRPQNHYCIHVDSKVSKLYA